MLLWYIVGIESMSQRPLFVFQFFNCTYILNSSLKYDQASKSYYTTKTASVTKYFQQCTVGGASISVHLDEDINKPTAIIGLRWSVQGWREDRPTWHVLVSISGTQCNALNSTCFCRSVKCLMPARNALASRLTYLGRRVPIEVRLTSSLQQTCISSECVSCCLADCGGSLRSPPAGVPTEDRPTDVLASPRWTAPPAAACDGVYSVNRLGP